VKNLTDEIRKTSVPEGSVAMWWLAQAGFVFKSADGKVIYLDPYLSDCCERLFGFRRMSLSPIDVEDVRADWVVSSHEHADHQDVDALPTIAWNSPGCRFVGPPSCAPEYEKCGVPAERVDIVNPGDSFALGSVKVFTVRADHGELSPAALSLLFDFGKVKVLATGDTALRIDWMQPLIDKKPDVLIPCINGVYGNLNSREAAELTAATNPRLAVPCHFWMFREQNGDPQSFADSCQALCPSVRAEFFKPGGGLLITATAIDAI
jgi:L-ascorbate 6-phosphate lactonase